MNSFCLIITEDYLPRIPLIHNSLNQYSDSEVHVLVCSNNVPESTEKIIYYPLEAIKNRPSYKIGSDEFRWALKAPFILKLLSKLEKVVYIDADIWFFSNPDFLFSMIKDTGLLLTPHRRNFDPFHNEETFYLHLTDGLFNAGFIGASRLGIPALKYWQHLCYFKVEKDPSRGLFVDQKYLDLVLIRFYKEIKILDHVGCNVARWNVHEFIEPLIFAHFTKKTIDDIKMGKIKALEEYLDEYPFA